MLSNIGFSAWEAENEKTRVTCQCRAEKCPWCSGQCTYQKIMTGKDTCSRKENW